MPVKKFVYCLCTMSFLYGVLLCSFYPVCFGARKSAFSVPKNPMPSLKSRVSSAWNRLTNSQYREHPKGTVSLNTPSQQPSPLQKEILTKQNLKVTLTDTMNFNKKEAQNYNNPEGIRQNHATAAQRLVARIDEVQKELERLKNVEKQLVKENQNILNKSPLVTNRPIIEQSAQELQSRTNQGLFKRVLRK